MRPRAPGFDSGLLRTAQGPLLYAVVSVMRSDTLSTAAGNLLLGQYFDDDLVRDIEEAAQLPVALRTLPTDYKSALPASIDELYRDRQDRLHWLLRDHAGTPLLRLTVQLPPRGADRRLVSAPLLAAFVTSIIGFAIILVLVQRGLIRPIQTIGRHLYDVRRHGDYSLRLNEERGDELGDLRTVGGQLLGDRMARRYGDETRAENRVGPSCEHLDVARTARQAGSQPEAELQALALPDPVFLHQPDLVGPLVERPQALQ